jgi:hypothetical protein
MRTQAFVPQSAMKALYVAVLHRPVGLNVHQHELLLFRPSDHHCAVGSSLSADAFALSRKYFCTDSQDKLYGVV